MKAILNCKNYLPLTKVCKFIQNLGKIKLIVNCNTPLNISCDVFGEGRKNCIRQEIPRITIEFEDKTWTGTPDELKDLLP